MKPHSETPKDIKRCVFCIVKERREAILKQAEQEAKEAKSRMKNTE